MPQVPIYQSQIQSSAGPGMPQASPADFGAGIGRAFDEAGAVAGKIEARADQRAELQASIDATTGISKFVLDQTQKTSALKNQYQPGDPDFIPNAMKSFDSDAGQVLSSFTDPRAQKYAAVHIASARLSLGENLLNFQAQQTTLKQGSDVAAASDVDANTLQSDPSQFGQVLKNAQTRVAVLDLPPAQKQILQDKTKNTLGWAAVTGQIEQNPNVALDQLNKGTWDGYLDPGHKAVLVNQAETAIRQVTALRLQGQREQNTALGLRLKDVEDTLRSGVPVAAQDVNNYVSMATAIGRPELAQSIGELGRANNLTSQLRQQTPVELQDRLMALDSRINAKGPDATRQDMLDRQTASRVLQAQQDGLKTDPLSYAAQSGTATVAPLDYSDPASMTQRRTTANAIASHYGVAPKFLTSSEEANLHDYLATATPEQKLSVASSIAQGFSGDAPAVFKSVGVNDPVFAHAAGMSLLGPQHAAIAGQIFAGQQIMAAGNKILPSPDKLNAAADAILGAAMSMRATDRATVIKAATALYAASALRVGADPAEVNPDLWSKALQQASGATGVNTDGQRGGIYTPATSGQGLFRRNNPIVLPAMMTGDEFDATLHGLKDGDLAASSVGGGAPHDGNGQPVTAATLRNGYLFDAGNGRYFISQDRLGTQFVRGSGPNGFYVLDMNKAKAAIARPGAWSAP